MSCSAREGLRFNQSTGSVTLIVKARYLAKDQLLSICPDSIVIPNLAQICKREHLDRLLCPIGTLKCPVWALKVYLKMTCSYRKSRTRLFLPIKGNHDISKTSVLRWVAYTIKLVYRKLTIRDISFLKIMAHKVRAPSSSWAFFHKVSLNDILKAAVWNQSSTFAKFFLRDMSQQVTNLHHLGPVAVAQKVVGARKFKSLMLKKTSSLQSQLYIWLR